jgi:hypothetical protein
LAVGGLVLGRGLAVFDQPLSDPRMSARHARVTFDDGGKVTVHDLGSANGTRLNGEPSMRGVVRPGDVLRFADTLMVHALGGRSDSEDDGPMIGTSAAMTAVRRSIDAVASRPRRRDPGESGPARRSSRGSSTRAAAGRVRSSR